MGNRWLKRDSSLGFAKQASYDVPNSTGGDFRWLPAAEDVSLDLARDVQRIQLLEGRLGATSAPTVGGKHGGKLKFKVVLRGMPSTYTQATTINAAAVPPEFDLLHAAMGWDGSAYVTEAHLAGGVDHYAAITGPTPAKITRKTGSDFRRGMPVATATNTVGVYSNITTGWINSRTDASPDVATLYENLSGTPLDDDDLLTVVAAYLQSSQPEPLTFRYVGKDAEFGYILTGAMCDSVTISANARQPLVAEFSYTFTAHTRQAIGGLQVPSARVALPAAIGRLGGRLTVGGTVHSTMADLKIELMNAYSYVDNPNGAEGVTAAILTTRTVKVSATIPIDSADAIPTGDDPYETALIAATPTSICLSLGTQPGGLCSIFLPALRHTAQPKLQEKGGFLAMQLELEAAPVTADADPYGTEDDLSACPAQSPIRVMLA